MYPTCNYTTFPITALFLEGWRQCAGCGLLVSVSLHTSCTPAAHQLLWTALFSLPLCSTGCLAIKCNTGWGTVFVRLTTYPAGSFLVAMCWQKVHNLPSCPGAECSMWLRVSQLVWLLSSGFSHQLI
jgi:hypothetical protein